MASRGWHHEQPSGWSFSSLPDQCTGDDALGGKVSMCSLIWCRHPHRERLDQTSAIYSKASSQKHQLHFYNFQLCVMQHASSRNHMETVDRVQSPGDHLLTGTSVCDREQRTLFASFSASSQRPLAIYARMRLIKRFCSVEGLSTSEVG